MWTTTGEIDIQTITVLLTMSGDDGITQTTIFIFSVTDTLRDPLSFSHTFSTSLNSDDCSLSFILFKTIKKRMKLTLELQLLLVSKIPGLSATNEDVHVLQDFT